MKRSGATQCFFFQAEDGIRDGRVTGVQTCALPIWLPAACCSRSAAVPRTQAGDQVAVLGSAIPVRGHRLVQSAVDVLVRPEGLRLEVVENGNGIVTTRTFLGSVTRVGVQLSGDVAVQVDRPSAEAAALAAGASVAVSLPAQPVLVAARRVS